MAILDLVNFYKTQITAWCKLLDGLRAFADNREALAKVPQAAAALTELTQIRDNPKLHARINRIEPLLATVTTINDQLAQEKRERALLSIDEKMAKVQAKLTAPSAMPNTSNKALRPLQDLKHRVASQTSIAQILHLQGQGGDSVDEAITLIEASSVAAAVKPTQVAGPGDTSKPVQKGCSQCVGACRQHHARGARSGFFQQNLPGI